MATAKKTTAKKTTAKKTTAKKTNSSLVMEVPEVPRQKSPQRFAESEVARTVVTTPKISTKDSIVPTTATPAASPRRGKLLRVTLIPVLVIGLVVFFSQNLDSSQESNNVASENVEIENEVTTPTENLTPTPTPTPTATTATAPVEIASVQSRFVYTSTGIKLSWILTGADSIESVEVSVVENNGESQIVGSYGPDTKFVEFLKEDNAGRASFTVSLMTKSGQKIIAPSLDVRGKFSAK